MANYWGHVFTWLAYLKIIDPTSYVGLMGVVFGSYVFKRQQEIKNERRKE